MLTEHAASVEAMGDTGGGETADPVDCEEKEEMAEGEEEQARWEDVDEDKCGAIVSVLKRELIHMEKNKKNLRRYLNYYIIVIAIVRMKLYVVESAACFRNFFWRTEIEQVWNIEWLYDKNLDYQLRREMPSIAKT